MESLSELKPPNCHAAVPHEVMFAVKKSKLCRTVLCDLGIYQNPFRLSIQNMCGFEYKVVQTKVICHTLRS